MTAWTLSILPTFGKYGILTVDVWTLSDGGSRVSAITKGGEFPGMLNEDTITFVQPRYELLKLESFVYANAGGSATILQCFYTQDSVLVPPNVSIPLSPSPTSTYTLRNLPSVVSPDVLLLSVYWRVHMRGSAENVRFGDDNGSITGKLHGNSGEPPGDSRAKPRQGG